MLGFSRETRHNTRVCEPAQKQSPGRTRGSIACTQKRSPCNGCMSRGYFQVPVLRHGRQNSGLSRRYGEDDLAALYVIISQALIRTKREFKIKQYNNIRKWQVQALTVRHFVCEKEQHIFFSRKFFGSAEKVADV